ncbi:MAG: hypothetical protein GX363_05870 [Clostridiales bacterium]|nr:hypothetical protein [Clostridiales bacterium]
MKKVIVTNNSKVKDYYSGKFEVNYLEDGTSYKVLEEAKEAVKKGGVVLQDPRKNLGSYYKSLVVYFNGKKNDDINEKSLSLVDKAISSYNKKAEKKPLLAGIIQNNDLDIVKKILN